MKLHLFDYYCESCGNHFQSPQLIGDAYGEFLMRTKCGDIVYLDTCEDKVFDEVEKIYIKLISIYKIEGTRLFIDLFHEIFTVSCDFSPQEQDYSIGQDPICPNCLKTDFSRWGPTNPPEFVELDVPAVSHVNWNKLSCEEKVKKIERAIKNYFDKKE